MVSPISRFSLLRPQRAKARWRRRHQQSVIVSFSLSIIPPDKLFGLSWDKWCHSLESENEFGINLASLANMRSLIHRNLYRGSVYAIWAEVLSWFTAGVPHWHINLLKASSLSCSQDLYCLGLPQVPPRQNYRSAASGRRSTGRLANRSAGSCSSNAMGSMKA